MSEFAVGFKDPNSMQLLQLKNLFGALPDDNIRHAILEVKEYKPGEPKPFWDKTEYIFHSTSGKQYLYVVLDAPTSGNELLYHIDMFTCSQGIHVKCLHSITGIHPPNSPLPSYAPLPPGTNQFAIEFKMPSTHIVPFKFSVYVRKTGTNAIHDADPQAGNDPPQLGTGP